MPTEKAAHDLTMLYLERMPDLKHAPVAYANMYKMVYEEIYKALKLR